MKYVLTIVIVLVVLAAGALLFAWSGVYNIAATEPHWPITASFINMLKDRSIEAHSEGIQKPAANSAGLEQAAYSHYHEMCRRCHGAPGFEPEDFAKGLYPEPPSMTAGHLQKELSEAEIFWIVEHGLKMTGMPAFGPTHSEEKILGLVELVKDVPQMSPEQYRQRVKAENPDADMGQGHTHGD